VLQLRANLIYALALTGAPEEAIERVELAATHPSFWQTYKFMNPVTQKVEPKDMYCERLDQTVVCGGVYQL
jgi:hypothetical protein